MNLKTKSALFTGLLPYLWPHRTQLALYLGITFSATLLELLGPWPMKILVDSVLGDHPLPGAFEQMARPVVNNSKIALLAITVLAGIGLKLVLSLLKVCNSFISVTVRQKIVLELKSTLFYHLQNQSLSFYDRRRLGDIVSRVNNDVWGIDESILTVMPLIAACISLAGMFWVMVYLNWQLAIVSLAIVPLFYATYGFYSKRFDEQVEEVQRLEGESVSIVQEVLAGLRVVKAFTREKHEHSRFVRQGRSAAEARIRLTNQQVIYSATVGLITTAGTSIVLGLGAYQILRGSLTLGELLVMLSYLASVYGPLESISTAATFMHGYLAKLRRIFEILDVPPEIEDRPRAKALPSAKGRVVFERVSFAYPERECVLRDITFKVEPGELIGIVGPTGAGKTTLVSLIPRFYDPVAGRVLVDDRDVRDVRVKSLRRQISSVLQESILFWGTIQENIQYGRLEATQEEVIEAAKLANAHEFISQLPEGYATHVGERGLTLSGGEKQRLSIARAFLRNAPILILDEPSSALDALTESQLLEAIERLMKGRTTFIIAHRLSTLRSADRILVLDHGEIVEQGVHSELIERAGLYESLYRHQTEFAGAQSSPDSEPSRGDW
jgi:ATP-binding cassette, subfamily B, bacterial